jgi:plasmid stability protein
MSHDEILVDYPYLQREDIVACLDFAAKQARREEPPHTSRSLRTDRGCRTTNSGTTPPARQLRRDPGLRSRSSDVATTIASTAYAPRHRRPIVAHRRHAYNACIALNRGSMSQMTIRNVDDELKRLLRVRAAHHGHSMEEEARQILRRALSRSDAPRDDLAATIHARFAALRGVELEPPKRGPARRPPDFSR